MGDKKLKGKQVMANQTLPMEANEQKFKEKLPNVFRRYNEQSSKKKEINRKIEATEQSNSKISIKIDPKPTSSESVKKPVKSGKYFQKIEEVAGRAVDDILLENMQLRNRNLQAGEQILSINKKIDIALETLIQLLEVELSLNPEIAVPIADEYQVNKRNESARDKITDIVSIAQALRKIRYYYHPSIDEWVEVVETSKQHMKIAQEEAEIFKGKWSDAQQELEELRTKERERIKQERKRNRKMEAKGITIRVNDHQHIKALTVPSEEVPFINEVNKEFEITAGMTEEFPTIETYESTESIEVLELEPSLQEVKEKEEIYVTSSYQVPRPTTTTNNEQNKESGFNLPTTIGAVQQINEQDDLLTTIKKPKYMHILDSHGYQYTTSPNPHFDIMIQTKEEEVPLIYIDYLIEDANSFGEIMEGTDNVYFLFEKQEHMKKGNIKFASWLLKSRERRKSVKFSLTTLDDLQSRGMGELDSL